MSTQKKDIVVLISGSGTNLQAIIDAIKKGEIERGEIKVVISNRREAYGLKRAESANIPTKYFPLKPYTDAGKTREEYDKDLAEVMKPFSPSLIVLAGWMHILSASFLNQFEGKVINLHPALPGQFPGVNAIQKAYEAFKRGEITETGVMVHKVIPEIDAGETVLTASVPIMETDTLSQLEDKMHQAEHKLLVQAVNKNNKPTSIKQANNCIHNSYIATCKKHVYPIFPAFMLKQRIKSVLFPDWFAAKPSINPEPITDGTNAALCTLIPTANSCYAQGFIQGMPK